MSDQFREWLTSEMEKRRFSQRALAKETGISQPVVSRVLNGEVKPSVDFCIKVARLFEYSHEFVLNLAGILPPASPVSDSDDPALQELIELVKRLSHTRRKQALDFLRYLYQSSKDE